VQVCKTCQTGSIPVSASFEIKGYETELDKCKWSQFPKNLIIWKKKDLQKLNILESNP
jgi:hypothetical protein